MLLQFGFLNFE